MSTVPHSVDAGLCGGLNPAAVLTTRGSVAVVSANVGGRAADSRRNHIEVVQLHLHARVLRTVTAWDIQAGRSPGSQGTTRLGQQGKGWAGAAGLGCLGTNWCHRNVQEVKEGGNSLTSSEPGIDLID